MYYQTPLFAFCSFLLVSIRILVPPRGPLPKILSPATPGPLLAVSDVNISPATNATPTTQHRADPDPPAHSALIVKQPQQPHHLSLSLLAARDLNLKIPQPPSPAVCHGAEQSSSTRNPSSNPSNSMNSPCH